MHCCRFPAMDPLFCSVLYSPGLQVHAVLCPGSWLRQSQQTQLTSSWVWLGGPRHVYWGWVTYLHELPACEVSWAHCVFWSRNLDKIHHYLMLLKTDERLSDWTELNWRLMKGCRGLIVLILSLFSKWLLCTGLLFQVFFWVLVPACFLGLRVCSSTHVSPAGSHQPLWFRAARTHILVNRPFCEYYLIYTSLN